MDVITLLLLIIGAACFAAAALGYRWNGLRLVAGGLFCWILIELIAALDRAIN